MPRTSTRTPAAPAFAPAVLAPRHDGWTAGRQRLFIETLAETGRVADAARAAGMSVRSAYRLRRDPRGRAFVRAWERALYAASHRLAELAFERAIAGRVREYWKDGELVATTREPSDNLLMFLLRHLQPDVFTLRDRPLRSPAEVSERQLPEMLERLEDAGDIGGDTGNAGLPAAAESPPLACARESA